jgi:hypothetical protein
MCEGSKREGKKGKEKERKNLQEKERGVWRGGRKATLYFGRCLEAGTFQSSALSLSPTSPFVTLLSWILRYLPCYSAWSIRWSYMLVWHGSGTGFYNNLTPQKQDFHCIPCLNHSIISRIIPIRPITYAIQEGNRCCNDPRQWHHI